MHKFLEDIFKTELMDLPDLFSSFLITVKNSFLKGLLEQMVYCEHYFKEEAYVMISFARDDQARK